MAKKNADAILAALGMNQTFMHDIVKEIKNLGGTSEEIVDQLSKPGTQLSREFAKLFMSCIGATAKQGLRVIVDYGLPLKEMINAGHYDWKNDDITAARFPVEGDGQQEVWIELLHYGKNMNTDAVLNDMEKRGYEPIEHAKLLALGAQYSDEQRNHPIIALGSSCVIDGSRYVPCLGLDGDERSLSLSYSGDGWGGHCQFAAVRKS